MTQEEYENTINEMLGQVYDIILPLQDTYSNSKDWVIGRGGCLHLKEDVKAKTFMPRVRRVLNKYSHILELNLCGWDRRNHAINLTIKNRKEI